MTKPLNLWPLTGLRLHLVAELSLRFLRSVGGGWCGDMRWPRVPRHQGPLLHVLGRHVARVVVHHGPGSAHHRGTVQRALRPEPWPLLHCWRVRREVLVESSHVVHIRVGEDGSDSWPWNVLDRGGPGPSTGREVPGRHLSVKPFLVLIIVLEVVRRKFLMKRRS